MSPRSCSGGPKSSPRGPKTAPRAARSAPRAQARPWAPKVRQEALREAPGAHFRLILGGPGLHFQAIEASFSKLARAPPDNRKHSSKSLVKRSCVGLAGVWGQKTQPPRGIHVFLRTIRDPRSDVRPPVSEIRDPRSEIRDPTYAPPYPRSEIRDPRSEIRDLGPGTRDQRSEIQKDFFVYESNLPPRRAF